MNPSVWVKLKLFCCYDKLKSIILKKDPKSCPDLSYVFKREIVIQVEPGGENRHEELD